MTKVYKQLLFQNFMNLRKFRRLLLSLPKNARVLDAGCGSGNNSRFMLKVRPDLVVHCLDINSLHRSSVQSFAHFHCGSVEQMSFFGDGFFDLVVCFHVLEHLYDPYKAVSEFKRVLKHRGYLVAESPHWISTIMPVGFNFFDDPTHIRPFSLASFRKYLFHDFRILYLRFEAPVFFFLSGLYGIKGFSYWFRRMINLLGIYRTAVFLIARNP